MRRLGLAMRWPSPHVRPGIFFAAALLPDNGVSVRPGSTLNNAAMFDLAWFWI
jgi:hypothetical protein